MALLTRKGGGGGAVREDERMLAVETVFDLTLCLVDLKLPLRLY